MGEKARDEVRCSSWLPEEFGFTCEVSGAGLH